MKVYNLACHNDHDFEGWFSSEEDFTSQQARRLLSCPVCDSHEVRRLPSAPRLSLSGGGQDWRPDVRRALAAMLKEMAEKSADVGERFADEVRRMHYGETPARAIRGVATPREVADLVEEGIDVLPLPDTAAAKPSLH